MQDRNVLMVVAVVAGVGWLTACPALGQTPLDYVESSTGLDTPRMEGGRTEIEMGDVDGDGHVDLVSIGDHGSPYVNTNEHGIMVWFGDGAGTWSVFQEGNFGYGGVALGDVNNDGLMDVGYGMHHAYSNNDFGNQILEVALGDGTGRNWTPWDDGLATNGESWGMFGTDFADVDNDGDLDVGSISFGCCAGIHVYRNNGDGTWTQSFGFLGGNSSQDFAFGDVNGDGLTDFASAHGDGTVYLGDGTGDFALADGNLPLPAWRPGIALGDVNDDGRDDLSFVTSDGGLAVWSWAGPGTWDDLSGSLPSGGNFRSTQIVDMNLDGHGDLVAFSGSGLVVYGGDGGGSWEQIASIATPSNCGFSALRAGVDADHNGYPDMVLISEEDCDPWGGGANRPRFFAESSTPESAWIYPKRPRGGETFFAGSVRFVDWHAAIPDPGPALMDIEVSVAGPDGPWFPVASGVPSNGRYQWLLPAALPDSADCYLRYTLGGGVGEGATVVTPSAFTIVGAPIDVFGDSDGDGDIDLFDFAEFLACVSGPAGGVADGCGLFDFDRDFDVDWHDAGAFLLVFTGPPAN